MRIFLRHYRVVGVLLKFEAEYSLYRAEQG